MATELEIAGELALLREKLRSGYAADLVRQANLSSTTVAKLLGVAQPTAWSYLNGRHFPRRRTALRLAELLRDLEVIDRA